MEGIPSVFERSERAQDAEIDLSCKSDLFVALDANITVSVENWDWTKSLVDERILAS